MVLENKTQTKKRATITTSSVPVDVLATVEKSTEAANVLSCRSPDATFEISPTEIRFDNFVMHESYEIPLCLKNVSNEAQNVCVQQLHDRFVTIIPPKSHAKTAKVAPGLTVVYKVVFRAEEERSYNSEIIVSTNFEEFSIPLYAVTNRGRLDLPSSLELSPSPVRGSGTTTLFLRNSGQLNCIWRAVCHPPFAVSPSSGVVPPEGGILPVSVAFTPPLLQRYDGVISFLLGPEEDVVQELPVFGCGMELPITQDVSEIEFPDTFVTMENQLIVRVTNESNHTVNFKWKCDERECYENSALNTTVKQATESVAYAIQTLTGCASTQQRLAVSHVNYLTKEGRMFDDDSFTIEPAKGVIYGRGMKEFLVTFNPQLAAEHFSTAYLEIDGKSKRLPLQMKGKALAPQCELEFSTLDIGDIVVGAVHVYQVEIVNKGFIEARYRVMPQDTLMGRKFTFDPSEGVLAPGAVQVLSIRLESDLLGVILESFNIYVHGSLDYLKLFFRGRVTCPSLQFDRKELNFGNVSYTTSHSMAVQMTNTGKFDIKFRLRILDPSPLYQYMSVTPAEGIVPEGAVCDVYVNLDANIVGPSETKLLVDVEGVGDAVHTLPIKMCCLVPTLQLSQDQLHYGQCFVGSDYTMNLEVVNKTALLGKFKVLLQELGGARANGAMITIGSQESEDGMETVEARGRKLVPIVLTPLIVGELRLTLYVRVLGSEEQPLPVLVTASACGPTVLLEPKQISFGSVELLQEKVVILKLTNTSTIKAHFTTEALHEGKGADPVFFLNPSHGEIPPESTFDVEVKAYLDDARTFKERVKVLVRHSESTPHFVDIVACGKGFAVLSADDEETIDFGDTFTGLAVEKKMIILNKGRRDIEVMWSGVGRSYGERASSSPAFRIVPEMCLIPARGCAKFVVHGACAAKGQVVEHFVLKDKEKYRVILSKDVKGNFIVPAVSYSTKKVLFDYIYGAEGDTGCAVTTKTFTMKNTCSRTLHVLLRCVTTYKGDNPPFVLENPTTFALASGETHIVGVTCNALYRGDNVAHSAKGHVLVAYSNHSVTETVALVVNVALPNIAIQPEPRFLNFGSVLADTERRIPLTLTNMSQIVSSNFMWSVNNAKPASPGSLSKSFPDDNADLVEQNLTKRFDIVPFRGTIPPGESRIVEAVFYGSRGRHEAVATCKLEGGPSYDVDLVGWSDVTVQFDCTDLDFGTIHYKDQATKRIRISSPSRVAVPFTVDLSRVKQAKSVSVKPMKGVVTTKLYLTVTFRPLIPDEIVETFTVQVGHLDPQVVTVRGLGQVPTVSVVPVGKDLKLYRADDPIYSEFFEELNYREWVPYHVRVGSAHSRPQAESVAIEAERLALCQRILPSFKADRPVRGSSPSIPRIPGENSQEEELPLLARYVVDFGYITRLEVPTAKLLLKNTSTCGANVALDKRSQRCMDMIVEPTKIPVLPPFTDTEITVTLKLSETEVANNGAHQKELTFNIVKGPRIVLEMRYFLATPALTPHLQTIDFGTLVLGRCHVKNILFYNLEAAPCTWKFKLAESKSKDGHRASASLYSVGETSKKQFILSQDRGTLPPSSCMAIKMTFISRYVGPAKACMRLRFASNPNDVHMTFHANVVCLDVSISPAPLVFLPVIPFDVVHHTFTIRNDEERPVEVFCMNYDQKYRTEASIMQHCLSQVEAVDGEKKVFLPIRDVGDALPDELVEATYGMLLTREGTLEWTTVGESIDREAENPRSSSNRRLGRVKKSSSIGLFSEGQELSASDETLFLHSKGHSDFTKAKVILLVGPPCSGKTTQVTKLMESPGIVGLDLDAMVLSEAEYDTAEGEAIRGLLTREKHETLPVVASMSRKNFDKNSPPAALNDSKAFIILNTLIQRYLKSVVDCTAVVIDDLKCILVEDRGTVLFAISKAVQSCGMALKVVSLAVSEVVAKLRQNLIIQEGCRRMVESASVELLTEEQYEELTDEEREDYNHRLIFFNECKRKLKDVSKQVALLVVEKETNKHMTVQEALDAEIAAREEQEEKARMATKGRKFAPDQRAKPLWSSLDEMEQYKELYTILRGVKDFEHIVVDGEQCENLSDHLLLQNHGDQSAEKFFTTTVETCDDKKSIMDLFSTTRCGMWEYFTGERAADVYQTYEEFRMFSLPPREIFVKKGAKVQQPVPVTPMVENYRWTIQPKSSMEVNMVFCSDKINNTTYCLTFGITGTDQRLLLPIETCASQPEICRDERNVFGAVRTRTVIGRHPCRVFILSRRTYEFGPLIVYSNDSNNCTSGVSSKLASTLRTGDVTCLGKSVTSSREFVAQETMTFANTGIFPAELSISFGREKETTFSVIPNKLTIPVGEKGTVALRAHPDTIGEITSRLIVTVRDNPTPWFVFVSCIGTRPAVTLDGKKEIQLQFDRCLVTRTMEQRFVVSNVSFMPITWRLTGTDKLSSELAFNVVGGVLEVGGAQTIILTYKPLRPALHSFSLKVEVTDADDVLFESLPVTVKAESHDAVVEWTRHVNFKMMHVGETKKECIRILNKSPYDVGFMLRMPKLLQSLVTLSPASGTVRGMCGFKDAAVASVEVSVRFEKEGEIPSELGVIEASFFDPTSNELLYPVQTITLTAEAWFNQFSIRPSFIDFGPCVLNQKKVATFELCNMGLFPLNFRLFNFKKGVGASCEEEETTHRRPRKGTKNDVGFQLGSFSITPIFGTVGVGESCVFNVVSVLSQREYQKETLGIYVDHCEEELEKNGTPFLIVASPTTPGIVGNLSSSQDVETVFEEQQVVASLACFNGAVRAFAKKERLFSFGKLLVGGKIEERFRIANLSTLTCTVKIRLLPKASYDSREKEKKERKERSSAGRVEGFTLLIDGETCDRGTMQLSSFESRFVTVCFTPDCLQVFNGYFEAIAVDGTDPNTNSLHFGLSGEGILPSVECILPPPLQTSCPIVVNSSSTGGPKGKSKEGARAVVPKVPTSDAMLNPSPDTIQMPLAFVGTSVSREFTVRNTSEMPVHIRVTAPDELPQGLSVKGLREELVIPPTGEVNFAVVLSPMRVDKWRARLRVSVTENPFDDRELWVVGESFFEPISFHNTDPLFGDRLTLGYWYLSLAKEHTFTVRNNTPHPVRFEWAHPSRYLTFCPRVGRMRSGSSKDITVRLYSNTVTKESVSCMLRVTSIESVGGSEWDDRCKDQLGKSNASEIEEASVVADVESRYSARKLGDSAVEPPYQVTDYVKLQKTLLVSYACEQTNYKITMPMNNNSDLADRIVFPTTKIFQKQFLTLRIENLGSNVLPFSFDVQKCGGDSSSSNEVFSPFSVSPACGFIEPQKSEEVELAFSPKSVEVPEHMLVVNMHHSAKPQLLIPLQGSAECPLVHFNVPNCDYFETRVDGEVGGIIPPSTIPILFNVCGLNTKSVVTFKVINPTAYIHRFEWISNQNTSELAPFRCLTPAGSIASGKQCEMAFEYTSTSLATRESLWNFYIFDHIAIPFLLVGKVYEPSVFLSVNKVLFGGTLIGVRNERVVYLENREDTPIPFNFDSVSASAEKDFVGVKPSRGVIDPNSTLALTIWFSPKEEIAVNIKLICRVKRATNPLTINVKGEGLRTHFSLLMDNVNNSDASEPVQVPAFHCFDYNLGRVQVNTAVEKKLYLQNDGRCPLNFTAVSPEHRFFRLSGNICTLQAKQRAELTLSFLPTSTEVIRNLPLIFRIEKRTVYTIHLSAISYIPKLSLSFSKFDFGLCFISDYMMDQSPAPATLCIKNEENAESLTVECLLSKDKFFKIDANYLALSPEETQQLNISFTPSEVGEFLCDLKLLVNGIHATYVPIRGEGIIPKIDVSPRVARLGIARIGVTRTVELRLECRSGVPTTVSLAKCIDEELMARGVSITPNNTFTMRPGDIRTVTAVFKPPNRMVEFHREVSMIVCGKVVPFVVFTGACEDAEVHTDVQNVLFNNVMIGTVASRRVVIMNSGDISQRFSWELTPDTSKQIKIAPSGGVIRAHGEQICEFLYSPTSLGNSIRTAIMLEFDNAPPITLNVEAHCVDIVKPDTVLEFVCKVGSTVTKTVTIENPTDNVWTLRPVLNSKGWSALKILTVHPKGRGTLPITYAPLVYTGEKDVATMFIPYPSGDGRSILLEGMSLSMIDGTTSIEKTVEVTTTHQEVFELVNNTANILRFRSSVSWLNESVKNSVSVKMPMAIDVPARQKREIGVDITPFVEGVLHGTFIFNCSSHEGNSQSFEVALKVVPKTETLKAELVAAVRTLATYKIPITNNLPRSATFTTRVENGSDALFVDPHIAVAANSTAELLVRFFPLVHKEYPVATVTATSSEAGIVACKMKLNSIPPPHEGVTRISCSLGQSVEFTLKFTSYNKSNCEYSLRYCDESKACHFSRVGNQNNIRAPGCSRPEGQEVSVDMLYEPSQIGDIRQIIEVSSNTGVYTFPIVASCQPPQRQGPFAVRPGATTPLTFKNVFNEPLTVNITTDSPSFFVSKSVETVPPKKAIIIGVQYRQDDQQRNVHAAKLTVSGTHRCETISWLYYLKLVSADTNVPVS